MGSLASMAKEMDGTVLFLTGKVRFRGSCLFLLDMAKGLNDAGIKTALMCSSAGLEGEAERLGLSCREWASVPGAWRVLCSGKAAPRLLRARSVRLIHAHGQKLGPIGRRLLASARLPVVYTPQPFAFDTRRARRVQRYAQRVIAMDERLREDCVNRARIPKDRVELVRPGVDVDATPVSLPRAGERVPVVGSVGLMTGGEGQDVFLRSAREILDSGRKAQFVVAGDGPYEKKLRVLCEDLGLSANVTFVTRMAGCRGVIEALDVFVRPSLTAGLGYILAQAMAFGKAVVATDVGGVYNMIEDGRAGVLVDRGRSDLLTEAISGFLDEPERAQQFGWRAREFVRENYRIGAAVEKTIAVYESAIKDFRTDFRTDFRADFEADLKSAARSR